MQGALLESQATRPRRIRGRLEAHGVSLRDDQIAALNREAVQRQGGRSEVLREIVDGWMARSGLSEAPAVVAGVLGELAAERQRADGKWGGAQHDDALTPDQWWAVLTDYAGWARRMWVMGSPDQARRRLVQLAALAVAAVEVIDRKTEG